MTEHLPAGHRPPCRWRLIDTGPLDGPANMAIDEALLTCFDPDSSLPVLRLYGWNPPCLSLGRFQRTDEVLNLVRCQEAGVPIVRRITGGGVIYHTAELTYSLVCAPHQIPPATSIKDSFRVLTSFLLAFYHGLGLPARYAVDCHTGAGQLGERTPFCFAGKEEYDILINGRKIGGNAQRRLRRTIFQHGSIPLQDLSAVGAAFMREQPSGLTNGITSLQDEGIQREEAQLKQLLTDAFRQRLDAVLERSELTGDETDAARSLLEKYRGETWNRDGE